MRFVTSPWAFWACLSAVMVLALMPAAARLPSTGWDKGNHLLAFTVLAALGLMAYPAHTVAVLLGLLVFGGLIELLQSLTPDRMAEWTDWLADSLGLLLGWGIVLGWGMATSEQK